MHRRSGGLAGVGVQYDAATIGTPLGFDSARQEVQRDLSRCYNLEVRRRFMPKGLIAYGAGCPKNDAEIRRLGGPEGRGSFAASAARTPCSKPRRVLDTENKPTPYPNPFLRFSSPFCEFCVTVPSIVGPSV